MNIQALVPDSQRPLLNFPVLFNYLSAVVVSLQGTLPAVASSLPPALSTTLQIALAVMSGIIIQRQKELINKLSDAVRVTPPEPPVDVPVNIIQAK